jgi:hypothetical protein
MIKSFLTLVAFVCFSLSAISQKSQITGVVKDTSVKSGVIHAVVALLSKGDSMLVSFSRTNEKGEYKLGPVDAGNGTSL